MEGFYFVLASCGCYLLGISSKVRINRKRNRKMVFMISCLFTIAMVLLHVFSVSNLIGEETMRICRKIGINPISKDRVYESSKKDLDSMVSLTVNGKTYWYEKLSEEK